MNDDNDAFDLWWAWVCHHRCPPAPAETGVTVAHLAHTHPSGSKIHFRSITCAIGRAKLCHRLTVCQNGWSSGTAHGERSRGCRFQSSITWGSAGLHRRFPPYTENLSKFDRQYGL